MRKWVSLIISVLTVGVLVACGDVRPEEMTEVSIISGWVKCGILFSISHVTNSLNLPTFLFEEAAKCLGIFCGKAIDALNS